MVTSRAWLVHTPVPIADIVQKKGKIAIGWKAMGDLSRFKTPTEMKEKFREIYSTKSDTKVAIGTGTLHRFVNEMKDGDFVLTPLKTSREVLIGKIERGYIYDSTDISPDYPNLRNVNWLKKVSRDDLSQPFRNAIGGLLTVFNIDAFVTDINELLSLTKKKLEEVKEAKSQAEPPFHEQVQAQADAMISDLLDNIDPYDLQEFTAGLIKAIRFNVQIGPQGADARVDITAHPDVFGFQSPHIKVQVKHRKSQAGAPEIQQLAGAAGQNEALFISTGGFTAQAIKEAEKHPKLALVDRDRFVELLKEYYDKLDPEYQSWIPMKRIYVPVSQKSR